MARSLPRLLLLLVIAFAMPIQGVAATMANVCMAGGHHGAGTHHEHGAASHEHPGSGALHPHAHHHDGEADGKSQGARCAPCVSCCAASAIASSPQVLVPEKAAYGIIAASPSSVEGVALARLDRPPLAL
jgi:hypothetical protein